MSIRISDPFKIFSSIEIPMNPFKLGRSQYLNEVVHFTPIPHSDLHYTELKVDNARCSWEGTNDFQATFLNFLDSLTKYENERLKGDTRLPAKLAVISQTKEFVNISATAFTEVKILYSDINKFKNELLLKTNNEETKEQLKQLNLLREELDNLKLPPQLTEDSAKLYSKQVQETLPSLKQKLELLKELSIVNIRKDVEETTIQGQKILTTPAAASNDLNASPALEEANIAKKKEEQEKFLIAQKNRIFAKCDQALLLVQEAKKAFTSTFNELIKINPSAEQLFSDLRFLREGFWNLQEKKCHDSDCRTLAEIEELKNEAELQIEVDREILKGIEEDINEATKTNQPLQGNIGQLKKHLSALEAYYRSNSFTPLSHQTKILIEVFHAFILADQQNNELFLKNLTNLSNELESLGHTKVTQQVDIFIKKFKQIYEHITNDINYFILDASLDSYLKIWNATLEEFEPLNDLCVELKEAESKLKLCMEEVRSKIDEIQVNNPTKHNLLKELLTNSNLDAQKLTHKDFEDIQKYIQNAYDLINNINQILSS